MMPPAERKEPGRGLAIVLAVLVHLIFVAVLVFGVNWQTKEASPVMAELWNSLPAPKAAPQPAPRPEPKPEPEPEPEPKPRPEPKPLPKPESKVEQPKVEQPKPAKAEIELKEKEKKRKEDERKKAEAEKRREELKRQEEKRQEEVLRRELEKQKLQKQERALQEQQRLHEAEVQRQQKEVASTLARQQASARQREVDGYKSKIRDKIKRFINNQPCQALNNPEAEFDVTLIPTGQLLMDPRLKRSSGNAACDQAIERGILRAQPLPLPPADSGFFSEFRELKLVLRPNE